MYERNYALVTPESHVWAGNPRWTNATTAHLISPAVGANFAMLLANMGPASSAAPPPEGHERWVGHVAAGRLCGCVGPSCAGAGCRGGPCKLTQPLPAA